MSKKIAENLNSILIELVGARPVVLNLVLAQIAKSILAGIFLSQILYWHGKGAQKDWIFKTIAEFESETCMTRSQQTLAIRIWKAFHVLEVEIRGIPPKRHFKTNLKVLFSLIEKHTGRKIRILANQYVESGKSIFKYRQNTTESTPKKTFINSSSQEDVARLHDLETRRKDLAKRMSVDRQRNRD